MGRLFCAPCHTMPTRSTGHRKECRQVASLNTWAGRTRFSPSTRFSLHQEVVTYGCDCESHRQCELELYHLYQVFYKGPPVHLNDQMLSHTQPSFFKANEISASFNTSYTCTSSALQPWDLIDETRVFLHNGSEGHDYSADHSLNAIPLEWCESAAMQLCQM